MGKLRSVPWKELVRRLHSLGFEGPYYRGKHPYMVRGSLTLTIPNPHKGEISVDPRARILRQAEVAREQWEGAEG